MNTNVSRRSFFIAGTSLLAGSALIQNCTATHSNASDFWEVIHHRRSARAYKATPVPNEDLKKIVDAARMAPTAGNQQPWKFLVITDPEKIEAMKIATYKKYEEYQLKNKDFDPEELPKFKKEQLEKLSKGYFSAPAYIVVLTDNNSQYPSYNGHDGPIAAGYLCLAAKAMGYGTVYITDAIPDDVTQTVLGIPEHYTRVCITPVGIAMDPPKSKEKKKLEEMIAFNKIDE